MDGQFNENNQNNRQGDPYQQQGGPYQQGPYQQQGGPYQQGPYQQQGGPYQQGMYQQQGNAYQQGNTYMGNGGGYYGGKLDAVIMRIWDVVCAVPSLLLSFILVAVFGRGNLTGVMAIGIAFIPLTAKMARSLIITEKKAVYVEACRSMGYSDMRIIFSHILPNVITTMIAQFTMDVGAAIVSMATLSYLGLGIQPPDADWGTLLENGMQNFYNNSILLAAPAVVIMLVTVAVNIFSDGIQEYIDPSQRTLPTFKQYERKLLRAQLPEKKGN